MTQRLIQHLDQCIKVLKKSSVSKVWIVKIMEEHGIKTFDCYYEGNK